MYFVKTPGWLKKIYSHYVWHIPTREKQLYLSFDDGPHPVATLFVLDTLKKYNAKATFFCIGKNVAAHGDIYRRILFEGHAVGNHTHDHLNGWKTDVAAYLENIQKASGYIESRLYRPPYGRIRKKQGKALREAGYNIIMWDVLSGDFDARITPKKCLENVVQNSGNGSVIVFHDSEKAFKNVCYALPEMLEFFSKKGYTFEALNP